MDCAVSTAQAPSTCMCDDVYCPNFSGGGVTFITPDPTAAPSPPTNHPTNTPSSSPSKSPNLVSAFVFFSLSTRVFLCFTI